MENKLSEKSNDSLSESQPSYLDNKLGGFQKYIRIMILVVGIFNLLLLIPDSLNIEFSTKLVGIFIIRGAFSLVLFGTFLLIKKMKTFKIFSMIVSGCELFSIFIFIFVLSRYNHPNFLIQTMGMIIFMIAVFLIPNRWAYMLFVSVSGAIAFLAYSFLFAKFSGITDYWAAVVYLSITILLCAIFAWNMERHQYREFAAKSELEYISSIDCLTKTANRTKLEEEANRWINFCHRQGLPLSLVFIDVDNLKKINDRHGHLIGDSVLTDLAQRIHSQLRASDVLSRWGGDEFVLLLPNVTLENAVMLSERIKNSIGENTFIQDMNVTCSFGVTVMKESSGFNDLIQEADSLMYEGKKLGKNTVQWENGGS